MPKPHLAVLPDSQRQLWQKFQSHAAFLTRHNFYLAGGSALVLQMGHRQSLDFDFFSNEKDLAEATQDWLEQFTRCVLRDLHRDTLHAEADGVKVSFIGAYKYPAVEPPATINGIQVASLVDIGLMKLLALTHRATLRDYIDLAALLQGPLDLKRLLDTSKKKYGENFNAMICLRALVSFTDVDPEMPVLMDRSLETSWQDILRNAVKKIT